MSEALTLLPVRSPAGHLQTPAGQLGLDPTHGRIVMASLALQEASLAALDGHLHRFSPVYLGQPTDPVDPARVPDADGLHVTLIASPAPDGTASQFDGAHRRAALLAAGHTWATAYMLAPDSPLFLTEQESQCLHNRGDLRPLWRRLQPHADALTQAFRSRGLSAVPAPTVQVGQPVPMPYAWLTPQGGTTVWPYLYKRVAGLIMDEARFCIRAAADHMQGRSAPTVYDTDQLLALPGADTDTAAPGDDDLDAPVLLTAIPGGLALVSGAVRLRARQAAGLNRTAACLPNPQGIVGADLQINSLAGYLADHAPARARGLLTLRFPSFPGVQ